MKRALLLLIPLGLGMALWAVNWKLDHPPQTGADKEFARLIQGANELEITSCLGHKSAQLRNDEVQRFVARIHLENSVAPQLQSCDARYTLHFQKEGRDLATFDLDFDAMGLVQTSTEKGLFIPSLEPRTGSKLGVFLSDLMESAPSSS